MAKSANKYNFNTIMSDLREGRYHPIYVLQGEEAYYIDQISDYIQDNALDEMAREFDQLVMYGKDLPDMATVVNAARQYPMMGQRRVVICREMQTADGRRVNWDDLQHYLNQPQPQTILVLCYKYGTLDSRKKVVKKLAEQAVLFTSDKLYDNEVEPWIRNYAQQHQWKIEPKAVGMLAENLGTDLTKIAGAMQKLQVALKDGESTITPKMVEEQVGISKDFNTFELLRALANNDIYKTNQIIRYFADNQKQYPIQMILPMLFTFYSNLLIYLYLPEADRRDNAKAAEAMGISPWAVRDYVPAAKHVNAWKAVRAISWIREADAKSKGFNYPNSSDSLGILQELTFNLLH